MANENIIFNVEALDYFFQKNDGLFIINVFANIKTIIFCPEKENAIYFIADSQEINGIFWIINRVINKNPTDWTINKTNFLICLSHSFNLNSESIFFRVYRDLTALQFFGFSNIAYKIKKEKGEITHRKKLYLVNYPNEKYSHKKTFRLVPLH